MRLQKKKKVTPGRVVAVLAAVAGLTLFFAVRKRADEDNYHPVAEQVANEHDKD